MAYNINRVILIGNLTRDPELKHTQGGEAVCEMGIAVNSREKQADGEWGDRADFFDITVWGSQAEACSQYLSKGALTGVEGRLRLERWETKDGQKRSKVKIIATTVQFLNMREETENGQTAMRSEPATSAASADFGGASDFSGPDDDIPF